MKIPFVDLRAQYLRIKEEIDSAVGEVIDSTHFIGGEKVENFERDFSRYVGAEYAVGVSSGTSALHLALKVLGVGPGDEVITACNTFIATAEAISLTGAKPVFVDVLEETLTIDPACVEKAVTPRTKVVIPVHLYGQPADMNAVRDVASRHGLAVVADAAQAHGSMLGKSRKAILGDITCFSFYPGKNLGAYGDGGMVVTDVEEYASRMRMLANHGRSTKYLHEEAGYNYRLDAIQAAVLGVKLKHLDVWTGERRSRAALYDSLFEGSEVRPVREGEENYHVYHLYVVRVKDRDRVREELGVKGIATGIHYPIPLHLLKAYEHLGIGEGAFPVAESAAGEILSLPMYPELEDEMVRFVSEAVMEAVR
jgi:dTDP-4-amino-4,6-dideoxygalactose transaminase